VNVFATDHPLTSQPSCFDKKLHPRLSIICSSLVAALFFTPFVIVFVVFSAITDDSGYSERVLPESWGEFGVFIAWAFTICAAGALVLVSAYRVITLFFPARGKD
jgi:hypothetical protein